MSDNYSAALAAMEAAVREHCPGLAAFTVRLQFDDEDGGNTFTREFPTGPAPLHDSRTGVISAAPTGGVTACDLRQKWADAYAAFKGAFDTPQMRRKMPDEFSSDARRRLSEFDEAFRSDGVMVAPAPKREVIGFEARQIGTTGWMLIDKEQAVELATDKTWEVRTLLAEPLGVMAAPCGSASGGLRCLSLSLRTRSDGAVKALLDPHGPELHQLCPVRVGQPDAAHLALVRRIGRRAPPALRGLLLVAHIPSNSSPKVGSGGSVALMALTMASACWRSPRATTVQPLIVAPISGSALPYRDGAGLKNAPPLLLT